jgi:hypothetical protein
LVGNSTKRGKNKKTRLEIIINQNENGTGMGCRHFNKMQERNTENTRRKKIESKDLTKRQDFESEQVLQTKTI